MELKDLVGSYKMLVAARPDVRHPFDDSKSGIAWCLERDGKSQIFMAFEDENDGYRSCMGTLFVADGDAYSLWSPDYIRRDVVVRHSDKSEYGGNADVIEIIDAANGHRWLRVGTDDIDDYYPAFVAVWTPMPNAEAD